VLISIFRSKHQKIEDHHIDEVIKYYWCISNIEKENQRGKEQPSACLCFLCISFDTICMTRVVTDCCNGIRYVSFSLSLSHFNIYLLPDWILLITSRIAFLLAILSNILPLEIESKLVLLLKYNIIVGESREKKSRETERQREKKWAYTTFSRKSFNHIRHYLKTYLESWVEVSVNRTQRPKKILRFCLFQI